MRGKILILGVLKNCGSSILTEFRNLEKAFSDFDREYFIVESDSTDDSLYYLDKLAGKEKSFRFHSAGKLEKSIPSRVSRISYCRNICLDYFEKGHSTDAYDYVAVVDLDGINRKLTKKSIDSCFDFDGWSVCTANQSGPYYDVFALRAKGWCEIDINQFLNQRKYESAKPAKVFFDAVISKMLFKRGNAPILVESAFGGCALYVANDLSGHKYSEFSANGDFQCEHVGLHESMRSEGSRIFVVPRFINASWTPNAVRGLMKYACLVLLGKTYYKFREKYIS